MKKIFVFALILMLALTLGLTAFAAEEGTTPAIAETIEGLATEPASVEKTATPTTTTVPGTAAPPNTQEEETLFSWIINRILLHLDKILTIVVGVIATIVAILQKNTIIPTLKAFVDKMGGAFSDFSKNNSGFQEGIQADIDVFKTELGEQRKSFDQAIFALAEEMKTALEEIRRIREEKDDAEIDRKVLAKTLANQEEMLNTVIQASTLTQWQKDKIGEIHEANCEAVKKLRPAAPLKSPKRPDGGEEA